MGFDIAARWALGRALPVCGNSLQTSQSRCGAPPNAGILGVTRKDCHPPNVCSRFHCFLHNWAVKTRPWLVVGTLLAALFLLFVWPTPYSHYTIDKYIRIRENRLTGTREVDTPYGWQPAEKALE